MDPVVPTKTTPLLPTPGALSAPPGPQTFCGTFGCLACLRARFRHLHSGDRGHSLPSPGPPASLSLLPGKSHRTTSHGRSPKLRLLSPSGRDFRLCLALIV